MTPLNILAEMWRRGVALSVNQGNIRYQSAEPLSQELRDSLRDHKEGILKILSLMQRLQAGSQWLGEQYAAHLAQQPGAANDETFTEALAGWDNLERQLRLTGYPYCIFGPGQQCPENSPVTCDECQPRQRQKGERRWSNPTEGLPSK